MFTPTHLLPRYDPSEAAKYQDRWDASEGQKIKEIVLEKIRKGAGEDFLQWDFEKGTLGFIENQWDLRGLQVFKEKIKFPHEDNFESIDFSFGSFYHSQFTNAHFQALFNFVKIYNCTFIDCDFYFNSFYGCRIEKTKFINCCFIENNSITNCVFSDVEMKSCFYPKNVFVDCKFDENTLFDKPLEKKLRPSRQELAFDNKQYSEIYKSVKEAYAVGGATRKSRSYFYAQKQAETRFNSRNFWEKMGGFVIENIAGYGIKPWRALETLFLFSTVGFCLFYFWGKVAVSKSIMLTAGAIFTFGAFTDELKRLGICFQLLYIFLSFSGIAFTALFITSVANIWFSER